MLPFELQISRLDHPNRNAEIYLMSVSRLFFEMFVFCMQMQARAPTVIKLQLPQQPTGCIPHVQPTSTVIKPRMRRGRGSATGGGG